VHWQEKQRRHQPNANPQEKPPSSDKLDGLLPTFDIPSESWKSSMSNASAEVKTASEEKLHYVVGSCDNVRRRLSFCPSATTLVAFSRVLDTEVVCQIKCKRWGCSHCGPRRITSLALRCKQARPNRLLTLTVDTKLYLTRREAYDSTRRKVTELASRIRRRFEEFEYIRILEVTKKGWPHYHLLVRSPYIPHNFLRDAWAELTGATIVDVRQMKKGNNVYFYVLKYLSKQKVIPWTNRRVSWSRHFFPANSKPVGQPLKLIDRELMSDHPAEVISLKWRDQCIVQFNRDVYIHSSSDETAEISLREFEEEHS